MRPEGRPARRASAGCRPPARSTHHPPAVHALRHSLRPATEGSLAGCTARLHGPGGDAVEQVCVATVLPALPPPPPPRPGARPRRPCCARAVLAECKVRQSSAACAHCEQQAWEAGGTEGPAANHLQTPNNEPHDFRSSAFAQSAHGHSHPSHASLETKKTPVIREQNAAPGILPARHRARGRWQSGFQIMHAMHAYCACDQSA